MLVSQSYNIFNRYGKDESALKDITRAFIEDLSEYSVDEITESFKKWRRHNSGMPAPSNIIDCVGDVKSEKNNGIKKYGEWSGDWNSYLAHLEDNNCLSENIERVGNGVYDLRDGYIPPNFKT